MSRPKAGKRTPGSELGAGEEGERELAATEPTTGEKFREQVVTIVMAVAIALGIRGFVIEPFRIPSGSMLPTLLIGDHLFVNKFVYGAKIPFTDIRLPGLRDPQRGDVVVFEVGRRPRSNSIVPLDYEPNAKADDFVKRIVGLPGDRVEVRRGRVLINSEPVDRVETGEIFTDDAGRALTAYSEQLNGCEHAVLDDPGLPGLEAGPITIKPGRYFMLGDNRDYSNDSRGWGTVRIQEFKGPAFLLYWSWDVNGNVLSFFNPLNWWQAEKRWDRLFRRVKCEPTEAEG